MQPQDLAVGRARNAWVWSWWSTTQIDHDSFAADDFSDRADEPSGQRVGVDAHRQA